MRRNRQGIQFALDETPDEILRRPGAGVEIVRAILRSVNEAKELKETKEVEESKKSQERGPAV